MINKTEYLALDAPSSHLRKGVTDRRDGPMDGWMYTPSYRDATAHLKSSLLTDELWLEIDTFTWRERWRASKRMVTTERTRKPSFTAQALDLFERMSEHKSVRLKSFLPEA